MIFILKNGTPLGWRRKRRRRRRRRYINEIYIHRYTKQNKQTTLMT
jgi:hypothetical protein